MNDIPYIACDIDGCVYPFVEQFTLLARIYADVDVHTEAAKWEFYEDWGKDEDWFRARYSSWFQQGKLLTQGDPLSRVAKDVEDNIELHWVTHREIDGVSPTEVRIATEQWLSSRGFQGVVHLATAEHTKSGIIREIDATGRTCIGVIEDHPGSCLEMALSGGCLGVLVDQPYNRVLTAEERGHLKRAATFRDATAAIWHQYRSDFHLASHPTPGGDADEQRN